MSKGSNSPSSFTQVSTNKDYAFTCATPGEYWFYLIVRNTIPSGESKYWESPSNAMGKVVVTATQICPMYGSFGYTPDRSETSSSVLGFAPSMNGAVIATNWDGVYVLTSGYSHDSYLGGNGYSFSINWYLGGNSVGTGYNLAIGDLCNNQGNTLSMVFRLSKNGYLYRISRCDRLIVPQ